MRQSEQRLRAQNRVLVDLAQRQALAASNVQAACRDITEGAAQCLDVARVSIWLYSDDRSTVRCVDLYELATRTHSVGAEFPTCSYPAYDHAIQTERAVAVGDVYTDPRTRDLADRFYRDLGITSSLDASIRVRGQLRGTVSCTHIGPKRRWTATDGRFLASMADLVALAIQGAEQARAERERRESEERFAAAFEYAPIGMAVVALGRRNQRVNRALCTMLGYSTSELLDLQLSSITHPADMPMTMEFWNRITAGEVDSYTIEKRYFHRDGHVIWANVSVTLVRDQQRQPRYVITQVEDITRRKEAEHQTAALLDVARDISGTLDRAELIDRVQRRTAALLPCDGVATFYRDEQRPVFRVVSYFGIPPDVVFDPQVLEFPPGTALGDQLARGEPIVIGDPRQQPWLPAEFLEHFRIKGALATPLIVRGTNMGALIVFNTDRTESFNAAQIRLCRGIAQQLAVAIEAADLHRAQKDDAQVMSALATIGREMIGSVETPALLDRLCRITAEALHCDCSQTLLWKPEEDAFMPAAVHGEKPEHWEAIRLIKIPRAAVAALLARLERKQIHQLPSWRSEDEPLSRMAASHGITRTLCVALRHQGEIVGLHAAGFRGRLEPFSAVQERIAIGLAQLGSLALENARLVEQLAHADRLKSEFVATVSHELRTPLNIILGYNDLLIEGAFGPVNEDQLQTLRRIATSSQALRELVNSILELSRLQAGRLPLDLHDVRLDELARDLDEEILPWIEKPGLSFTWNIAPEIPPLHTDPAKLKTVLKGLISNAFKFTEEGGVTVTAGLNGRGVDVAVTDTGIGIAPEMRSAIFEPFRQADASITRRYGGIGLGLYIVSRLVETLGGSLSFESEVGRGSRFRVWLPFDPRQLPSVSADAPGLSAEPSPAERH